MKRIVWVILISLVALALLAACQPLQEKVFLPTGENSSMVFSQNGDRVQEAVFAALTERNFRIKPPSKQQNPWIIEGEKTVEGVSKSYTTFVTCYLFCTAGSTRVQLAAEEKWEKVSRKFKWFLFIPYGMEPRREITKKGAITDGEFYRNFFAEVAKNLPESTTP